jgi:response regulator RpfG family c-di-GMP phosphodiesterase
VTARSSSGAGATSPRVRVLCVDDESRVLEAIATQHGRHYTIETASSGAAGLALLRVHPDVAVIVSDMRMPGMDGAAFLGAARALCPDAVRLLLTGYADVDAAIRAINDGQVFQFLTKPCQPAALRRAIDAASAQHALIVAERVLLEQTLHGAIQTLTDVLALSHPAAFGRATRLRQLVSELAQQLGLRARWQVEVAAMLSQLGYVALPAETADKVYFGRPLAFQERALVAELPRVTERLLGNIPRLEGVRAILADYSLPRAQRALDDEPALAAEILRVAVDFDAAESAGIPSADATSVLVGQAEAYRRDVLDALIRLRSGKEAREARELRRTELSLGMVLAEDVFLPNGTLLAARGYAITPRFLERMRNFPRDALRESLRVYVRPRT